MEWGAWHSKLEATGKADKHPAPPLFSDLEYIWDAFLALSSSRTGSIQFSEIESYLNLNGILNLERRQEIAHLIRIMDLEYLKFMKENK